MRFKTTGFLQCERSCLDHILDIDALSCTENKVFEACMTWVKFKVGRDLLTKDDLGDVLKKIRIGSITYEMLEDSEIKYKSVLEDCFPFLAIMILCTDKQNNPFGLKYRQLK